MRVAMVRSGEGARRFPRPRRGLIVASTILALVASAFAAFEVRDRSFVLSRVPAPLVVAEVEYRLEQSWGLGFLPGDNETGFVVYRLTDVSAEWARRQGDRLGEALAGGAKWRRTPVGDRGDRDDFSEWHPYDRDPQMMSVPRPAVHPPTIREYLEKYGFTIPIRDGSDAEADNAVQSQGSFYAYGRGGSVTIVDPGRGKVYFAYAG